MCLDEDNEQLDILTKVLELLYQAEDSLIEACDILYSYKTDTNFRNLNEVCLDLCEVINDTEREISCLNFTLN